MFLAAGAPMKPGQPLRFSSPLGWVILLAWALLAGPALSQETADYFQRNCANCHYIGGGKRVGPDLKDIQQSLQLRGRDWVLNMIRNPKGMIASDDYARKMFEEYNRVEMFVPPDMTPEKAEALLRLIEEEAKKKQSMFARGETKLPAQFSETQIAEGRDYFLGLKRFARGGPACLGCHSVQGASVLGGGALGPDLTQVFNKLKGREGLLGWLMSPPTPTMQPIYKPHPLEENERIVLIAYLESTRDRQSQDTVGRLNFFLLGLAGTAGGLVLFDFLWKRRFRGVRRLLVHGEEARSDI